MYLGRVAVANTILFYLLLECFNNDLRPSCSVVLSDDLDLQRLWNFLTKPSSAGLNPLKIVCKHGARSLSAWVYLYTFLLYSWQP